jgi:hypothetical protein
VDRDYVYFEDPYVHMGKGFIPRANFEDAWHNVMGGDLSKPVQNHVAIFIRRAGRAAPPRAQALDFSGLESGRLGSLNLLVTQFKGTVLPFDFVEDVRGFLASDSVRADAFIILRKDRQGRLTAIEGGRVSEQDDVVEINTVLGALAGLEGGGAQGARSGAEAAARVAAEGDFGLSPAELHRIAGKLPDDHSSIIILFENLWERRFREVVAKHGGSVVDQRLIGSDQLALLGRALRKGTATGG